MKTLIFIAIVFITSLGFSQNQPLINGVETFGNWTTETVGEMPQYWDGFNKEVIMGGAHVGDVECIKKDSADPQDSDYSVRIVSTSIMGGPAVPGMLTTGKLIIDFNSQSGDIEGGMPYSLTPTKLKGYYKYSPNGNDTAEISAWFSSNGSAIGGGELLISGQTNVWTEFTVDLTYMPGITPDTANVMFTSSNGMSAVPVGSALEIDHIWFEGGNVSIENKSLVMSDIKIYPNPAVDYIQIESSEDSKSIEVNIYSTTGQLMISTIINGSSEKVDLQNLSKGAYFFEIIRDGYRKVQSIMLN